MPLVRTDNHIPRYTIYGLRDLLCAPYLTISAVKTVMYRGEIYKIPQAQSDGRAQVVTFDGGSVLWMDRMAGSLTDPDKRLASKLKKRRFLQHQSILPPSTVHVVDDPEAQTAIAIRQYRPEHAGKEGKICAHLNQPERNLNKYVNVHIQ